MMTQRIALTVCALLLLLFGLVGDRFAAIHALDNNWLDYLSRQRALSHPAPDDIVIVDIDQYSLNQLADQLGNWPWPRAAHAELVEWLQRQGVKQIVFDIWFSEPDVFNRSSDDYFGDVLNQYPNIYLPTMEIPSNENSATPLIKNYARSFGFERTKDAIENARAFYFVPVVGEAKKWKIGSINFIADDDGIARRYDIVRLTQGWRLLSLPARVARDNGVTLPTHRYLRLDWYGPLDAPFTRFSFADLFNHAQTGQDEKALHGKTVFIGSTAAGIHDLKPTPIASQYPGLYMMATAYANLRENKPLQLWSHWSVIFLGVLPLLFMGFMQSRYKTKWRYPHAIMTLVFFAATGLTFFISVQLSQRGILLPVLSMAVLATVIFFTGVVLEYLNERRSRQQAIAVFSRFLDPRVVENLTAEGLTPQTLAAKSVQLTILFSDIRGFTTLSETRAPAEILSLLNDYFSRQVAIIFEHHGTLDKFIGDAIMAFWGAPIADSDHALNAVKAALAMSRALDEFKRERQLPDFDIGIGIHTGPAVVGMLGSEQRLEYTAIGDTINLGSRLEGLTKDKARILVSETTRLACGDALPFKAMGSYHVKGRQEAVTVYEPLDEESR